MKDAKKGRQFSAMQWSSTNKPTPEAQQPMQSIASKSAAQQEQTEQQLQTDLPLQSTQPVLSEQDSKPRMGGLLQLPVDVQNAFQTLRTNIQFMGIDKEIKTIVVTSAVPDEGKSTVALTLAIAMADAGKKTLIVDTDARRPMIGNRIKLHPQRTWLDVLASNAPVEEAVAQTSQVNLFFLDAEPQIPHAVELIGSNRFSKMIQDLSNAFDVVIFDTPPLGSFIEAAVLSAKVDGVLLVISTDKVNIAKEQEVLAQLEKANARLLGAVLNGVKTSRNNNYYYYYNRRGGKRERHARHKD